MSVSLSIITAMDENRLIGSNNSLPWHLPADFAYFKRVTMDKPIIMGRKTYESIGRPLPGRRNIIISRDPDYHAEGCETANSLQAALELVADQDEAMLIGGANLYAQTLELADTLYITEIHATFKGDAWFPVIDPEIWSETTREDHAADEKNAYAYSFVTYTRRQILASRA